MAGEVMEALVGTGSVSATTCPDPDLADLARKAGDDDPGVWEGYDPGDPRDLADDGVDWAELEVSLQAGPYPEEDLTYGLHHASTGLTRASLDGQALASVYEGTLLGAMTSLSALREKLDVLTYQAVAEGYGRGLHLDLGLGLVDWVRAYVPHLTLTQARDLADTARVARTPGHETLGTAVLSGRVSIDRAAQVARCLRRITGILTVDERDAYATILLEAAARPDLTDRELAHACTKVVHDLLDKKPEDERADAIHDLRTVTSRPLGQGLTRFTIDAPALAAATLHGLLASAAAAPRPSEDGTLDPRTPGQRRFDALIGTVERGMTAPGGPPSRARAALIAVVGIDPGTMDLTGPATTSTGDVLTRRETLQLACTADLTPVWMRPDGTLLALGRTQRYATPDQWKALVVRDGGCTFPGCTALPEWCDSHHIDHWQHGGTTDLANMTLLCGRHHTHVHHHNLTATIHAGAVTWHLDPQLPPPAPSDHQQRWPVTRRAAPAPPRPWRSRPPGLASDRPPGDEAASRAGQIDDPWEPRPGQATSTASTVAAASAACVDDPWAPPPHLGTVLT